MLSEQQAVGQGAASPATGKLDEGSRLADHRLRRWAWPLALTAVALAGLLLWAHVRYGSLVLAARYLNGERLVVSPGVVSFGEAKLGELCEFSVSLTNLGAADAVVLGSSTDCSCLTTDRFPLTIRRGETRELNIKGKLGPRAGDFNHVITFYTDSDDLPVFHVRVQGQVVE